MNPDKTWTHYWGQVTAHRIWILTLDVDNGKPRLDVPSRGLFCSITFWFPYMV
jgi:hypothetical protein